MKAPFIYKTDQGALRGGWDATVSLRLQMKAIKTSPVVKVCFVISPTDRMLVALCNPNDEYAACDVKQVTSNL